MSYHSNPIGTTSFFKAPIDQYGSANADSYNKASYINYPYAQTSLYNSSHVINSSPIPAIQPSFPPVSSAYSPHQPLNMQMPNSSANPSPLLSSPNGQLPSFSPNAGRAKRGRPATVLVFNGQEYRPRTLEERKFLLDQLANHKLPFIFDILTPKGGNYDPEYIEVKDEDDRRELITRLQKMLYHREHNDKMVPKKKLEEAKAELAQLQAKFQNHQNVIHMISNLTYESREDSVKVANCLANLIV